MTGSNQPDATEAPESILQRKLDAAEFRLKELDRAIRLPVVGCMVEGNGQPGTVLILAKCDGPLPVQQGMELLVVLPEDSS